MNNLILDNSAGAVFDPARPLGELQAVVEAAVKAVDDHALAAGIDVLAVVLFPSGEIRADYTYLAGV